MFNVTLSVGIILSMGHTNIDESWRIFCEDFSMQGEILFPSFCPSDIIYPNVNHILMDVGVFR